jgi:TPR repeat protein
MNTPLSYPGLKVALFFVLSLGFYPLRGQTKPAAQAAVQASRIIVQKDYDELRRAVGSVKPEELPALQQKADGGDIQSQITLGMLYQLGCGVVKADPAKEMIWYHKAADQGSSIAENQIGTYYDLREGHDQAEGFRWYRKAADHGDAVAQNNVAIMYADGFGVKADLAEAAVWYRKAVENGAYRDLPELLFLYDSGKAMPDKSLEENKKEGLRLLQSLADQGNAEAQYALAGVYKRGELGLPRDRAQMMSWLRKSAEKNPEAEIALSTAYTGGDGVHRDRAEAINWSRRAAEHGNAEARFDLGLYYEYGVGVHKDMGEAVQLVKAAANQGYARARHHLGEMYEEGRGVPKDKIAAIMWFILAQDTGGPDFKREFHPNTFSFHRRVSEKDQQEAQRRADAWREQHACRGSQD